MSRSTSAADTVAATCHSGPTAAPRGRTTALEDFTRGIWRENPILVQMMGLCPTLAVTNTLVNGVAMALATTVVLLASSIMVSALRNFIAYEVRIAAYVLIIATFVTVVDLFMKGMVPDVEKALGPFVFLIVVNCIILGRQEAFSSRNTVGRSILDALGYGGGFTLALVMMSTVRELLGYGSLWGHSLFGPHFQRWLIFVLPPGGFLTLGFIVLGINWWTQRRQPLPAHEHYAAERPQPRELYTTQAFREELVAAAVHLEPQPRHSAKSLHEVS